MSLIQVFTEMDRDKLLKKGNKLICTQKVGDKNVYFFNVKNFKFENLSDVQYLKSNKLMF